MKTLLMMLAFSLMFLTNGCSQKRVTLKPKLKTVDAKTQPNHSCKVEGTIDQHGNVTVSKQTSECIRTKLEICEKNNKKLKIGLRSANAQIDLLNAFGE